MASALAARIRAALSPLDQPGPEIGVSPFRAGEVSGGAVALKGIATLLAGRRSAANAADRRQRTDADLRYRALLTKQLEQKVNAPGEATISKTLPDGTPWTGTAQEYATHYNTFNPKAATTSDPRVHVPADDAQALGIPFDAETGTVSERDVRANRPRLTSKAVTERLTAALGDRRTRGMALDEAKLADRGMKMLDEREKEIADDALVRGTNYAEAAKRILLSPKASPTMKAQAAKRLGGVPFARGGTAGTDLLTAPESGALLYDTGAIDAAVKNAALKFQRWKMSQAKEMNRPQRESYMRRFQLGGPPSPGAAAGAADFLDRMESALSGIGAESDTSWLDRPAE